MLDVAVALYRSQFVRLIRLAALVIVPVELFSTIVLLSARPDSYTPGLSGNATPQFDTNSTLVVLAGTLVVLFVGFVASTFVVGLCARPVGDDYVGANIPDSGGTPIGPLLAAAALVALVNALGLAVCGLGYFVTSTFFAAALPAFVLERTRPSESLGRSYRLTRSNFFRVLLLLLAAHLLTSTLNLGLSTLVAALMHGGTSSTSNIVARGLASAVSSTLTTPFIATVAVVVYFDLRIREEGFDVQLLMQRNDERHAATAVRA